MIAKMAAALLVSLTMTFLYGCGRKVSEPGGGVERPKGLKGAPGLADGPAKPVESSESTQSDHQRIQGSWRPVTLTTGPRQKDHIDFAGDKVSWHVGKKTLEGTIVIDASKQPKQIDLKFSSEKDAPVVLLGIYDFRKELLVICLRVSGGLRPTKLEAGDDQTVLLFHRSMQGTQPEMKK
jgi:uncharacterized protein (TIGR03067 family)